MQLEVLVAAATYADVGINLLFALLVAYNNSVYDILQNDYTVF